ncbi:unnamed protein product [Adineta steineri]|uniref:Uncharacterized protein n=1 Tax=Adineta steineri TaxID=433720 RepID=A0A815TG59_9BILA|nr:unnamed protein product [Adineta steineri]
MVLRFGSIFLVLLLVNSNMSERVQRGIGLPGTCGFPCLTTGNKCINSGVCNDKNICDCTNLPSCGRIQCFEIGNKCVGFLGIGGGTCTACQQGLRCH